MIEKLNMHRPEEVMESRDQQMMRIAQKLDEVIEELNKVPQVKLNDWMRLSQDNKKG